MARRAGCAVPQRTNLSYHAEVRQYEGVPAEEFSEPEPNVIASSAGFSIRVLGRTGMRYVEGERSVRIDSEVLAEPRSIVMSKASMRAWEGSDAEPLSDADRDRVAANIKRAFDARSSKIDIRGPFDWDSVALRRPKRRD
jgi:hypothetical protein